VSLRTRLVAGLLVLAAVGLVLLAGVTYAEQRHFLYDRVDQQATAGAARVPPEDDARRGPAFGGGYGPPGRGGPAARGRSSRALPGQPLT
jgi:two-component system OmpR family sensor kinase